MDSLKYTEQEHKDAFYFWIGLFLYSISSLLREFIDDPGLIDKLFKYSGLILLLYSSIRLVSLKHLSNIYLRIILLFVFLWQLYMVAKGFEFTYDNIGASTTPYVFLPLLVPMLVFFPLPLLLNSFSRWAIFSNYLFLFLCLFPFFIPVSNGFIQFFCEILAIGGAFVFMCHKYYSKNQLILGTLVLLLTLLLATLEGRRNLMLIFGSYLAVGLFFFFYRSKIAGIEKKLLLILYLFLVSSLAYTYFINEKDTTFSVISNRATENTRETVFLAFFLDMNSSDWLVGKGYRGTYYCSSVDVGSDGISNDDREFIECGYLHLILKGGIIYLILMLLVFIPAVFLGFKSNNVLSKVSSSVVLIYIVDLFPFGLPVFNLKFFLLWICVCVCYNKSVRLMNDDEVSQLFLMNRV